MFLTSKIAILEKDYRFFPALLSEMEILEY